MATMHLAPMVLKRLSGLESVPIRHGKEKASQTYKQGALLLFDSGTGHLVEASADPALVQAVSMLAASGVTAADVPYLIPRKGMVFEVSMDESGAQGVYALAQTDMGKKYGAAKDSTTGFWYLDQDETSALVFEIVGFVSAIGDITPRVEVEFTLTAME
jgi:hypothetical protein